VETLMGTHKKTDKGTEYEDLSPNEPLDPNAKPAHPSPPIGPGPKSVGPLDFRPKDPPSKHPDTVPDPGTGPSDAEVDAVVAQLEATKAQLPHNPTAGTMGEILAAREAHPPYIDPDALRVVIDSVVAAIKWFREWRSHRGN
jgi:hypothetical protein